MIPNDPADFNESEGEAEVFDALRKLDDQHYVFHSLRWLNHQHAFAPARPKIAQGEADFAVFHPKSGIQSECTFLTLLQPFAGASLSIVSIAL